MASEYRTQNTSDLRCPCGKKSLSYDDAGELAVCDYCVVNNSDYAAWEWVQQYALAAITLDRIKSAFHAGVSWMQKNNLEYQNGWNAAVAFYRKELLAKATQMNILGGACIEIAVGYVDSLLQDNAQAEEKKGTSDA